MIEKFTVEITVKAIEIDKWGHPVMVLESGRKRGLFNVRIKKLIPDDVERINEPSDIMMTKEQWEAAERKIAEAKAK